ncbi:MAG TPA: HAD family hydrolase [Chthoniobacterales bacterium]
MQYRALICDLDGTLVDSLPGIEASSRHAVTVCLPDSTLPPMRSIIGPPIAKMFAGLWPHLGPDELGKLVSEFRVHYDREGCITAELYAGVADTLTSLADRGVTLFVLTNKPIAATRKILGHFGLLTQFRDVIAPDSGEPPFRSKPEGARFLQARHNLDPSSTAIIGDGIDDLAAARECGFSFVLADYGYGSASTRAVDGSTDKVASTFADVLSFL